jgi:hypothetical protein
LNAFKPFGGPIMTLSFRLLSGSLAFVLLAAVSNASPVVWTLNNVILSDGATASGTFTFDPDAGTRCGSFAPCGRYSNVNIATTTGASQAGATYSFVWGQDVVGCTGVSPDSTEVLFLTSSSANQTRNSALAFFFTGIGVFPPAGLTDAGGVIEVGNSSTAAGMVNEASCADASCSSPSNPERASAAGTVSAVPEPTTWLMLVTGFGLMTAPCVRRGETQTESSWHNVADRGPLIVPRLPGNGSQEKSGSEVRKLLLPPIQNRTQRIVEVPVLESKPSPFSRLGNHSLTAQNKIS